MSIQIKKLYDKHAKNPQINNEPSKTKQSFKNEVDINKIIAKYNKTGQFPELLQKNPKYGDFSNPLDYQTALNTVNDAHTQFQALSSKIRSRFNNDPVHFLEFTSDANNLEEMYTLGIAIKPVSDPNLGDTNGNAVNNQASGTDA